jgi:hypothetical protein
LGALAALVGFFPKYKYVILSSITTYKLITAYLYRTEPLSSLNVILLRQYTTAEFGVVGVVEVVGALGQSKYGDRNL